MEWSRLDRRLTCGGIAITGNAESAAHALPIPPVPLGWPPRIPTMSLLRLRTGFARSGVRERFERASLC